MIEEKKIKKIYKMSRKITKLIEEAGLFKEEPIQETTVVAELGKEQPVVEELPSPLEPSTPIEVQEQSQESKTESLKNTNLNSQEQEIQRLQEELSKARQQQSLNNFNFKNI